jgi:hypothetical protein
MEEVRRFKQKLATKTSNQPMSAAERMRQMRARKKARADGQEA